ncbi:MAG: amino acid ABC transporter substrate-binding protein [Atopobiaceae bacterium]|nr:amino acid ABC transporter substrate-binding protein [Atopobiaceae bacterium]MBR3315524.1 amino acid ABC transporter substrate-binding protein [Atopobiaceae bacterium]
MSQISRRQFLQGGTLFAGTLALTACGGGANEDATSTQVADEAAAGEGATADEAVATTDYTTVEEGKLTCISNLFFPPFESMNESTGEPEGFDIDVSKSLAEHMGLEVNWLPSQDFDTLVPTIKNGGKADVAIAGMTITDKRKEEVDMSDPYVDSNQSIVIKSGTDETAETLDDAEKVIAVQSGTTGQEWAQENLPNATIKPLSTIIEAMSGVQTGLYNAVVCDLPVSKYQIKTSYTDLEIIEEIPTGEQYGIAVSKDNPGLLEAVNSALAAMESDGSMDAIEAEWFGSAL